MSDPLGVQLGQVLEAMKKYRLGRGVDLDEVVRLIGDLETEFPGLYRQEAIELVVLSDQMGTLEALSGTGFVSRMASDSSPEMLHAAAFVYWRLGRGDAAATLESAATAGSQSVLMSFDTMMDLENRVRSAIDNYRASGSLRSRMAAWESFSQLAVDSEELRVLAEEFVEALETHSDLDSDVALSLLSTIDAGPPDQSVLRLAAFVAWRRGEFVKAAEFQNRSVAAPNLLRCAISTHSRALRANERPDLFPQIVSRRISKN